MADHDGVEPDRRVVDWLLDGDPAVRWQVRRDLLDHPVAAVATERARVATEGWGAALLAEQDPEGTWAGALYSPKWTSTTYTLLLLRQLGLRSGHPAALRGVARLLDGARWFDGGLDFTRSARHPETCVTSLVLGIAAAFGVEDERVDAARAWLLDQQLEDGGWNCESLRSGSTHGSFDTTLLALEALDEWDRAKGRDAAVTCAAQRGRTFFYDHRLYCSHRSGAVVDPAYRRMVFPPGWHHDLLRGLDHFATSAAPPDDRLTDAVELLVSKRRRDGTWTTNARHPGRYFFLLEPAGAPSRINTLRALRVLRWWDEAPRRAAGPPSGAGAV